MRHTAKSTQPEKPRDIAQKTAKRAAFDRDKVRKSSARASEAAERLLREMDDVLKHLPGKR